MCWLTFSIDDCIVRQIECILIDIFGAPEGKNRELSMRQRKLDQTF